MECSYQALVQGRDENGMRFKQKGEAVNLSRSGIFLILDGAIPECQEVSIRIILPTGHLEYGSSKLATVGTVVRRENRQDGALGIAIKFQNYRII
jgi:PilZ domain